MNDHELVRILDFVDRIRAPYSALPGEADEAGWRIAFYLVRSHLGGYPVTISKLAHVSGLPHATAIRRILAMIDAGQVVRRPTGSGRKTTLHPSEALQSQISDYARRTKEVVAETLGRRVSQESEQEYYFGGVAPGTQVIPPIELLRSRVERGVALKFLLNSDNYFVAMRNMWADFRSNLARNKDFELLPQPELYARVIENGRRKVSEFDVVCIDMPWIGEFAERGLIRPIGDDVRRMGVNPLDFHPTIWSTGSWRGTEYGVPIYCTIEVLAARSDLFEAAALPPPRTFDAVLGAGRALHDPARGRFGIVWNGGRGMPIASSFMFLMACCGQPVLSLRRTPQGYSTEGLTPRHMQPQVDSVAGRAALHYMHQLLDISPPNVLELDWEDAFEVFLAGHAGMIYAWTMRAARFEYEIGSAVRRRVDYFPQPAGPGGHNVSPIGGFLLCIPCNLPEERVPLAMEAISWMASREAMKAHVQNGFPIAPRFSVSADPEAAASSQIVRFVDRLLRQNMLQNWQRPPVPLYTAFENILGEEVHDALLGRKSDDVALTDAQSRMRELIG